MEHGLVTRGEDPADRRARRVAPTREGEALVARLHQSNRDRFARLLARLNEEDLRTVEGAFQHLLRAALQDAGEA